MKLADARFPRWLLLLLLPPRTRAANLGSVAAKIGHSSGLIGPFEGKSLQTKPD
jgi:hypothetical protein